MSIGLWFIRLKLNSSNLRALFLIILFPFSAILVMPHFQYFASVLFPPHFTWAIPSNHRFKYGNMYILLVHPVFTQVHKFLLLHHHTLLTYESNASCLAIFIFMRPGDFLTTFACTKLSGRNQDSVSHNKLRCVESPEWQMRKRLSASDKCLRLHVKTYKHIVALETVELCGRG